jgi:hypothetical protein
MSLAFATSAQELDRTLTVSPKEAVGGEARHALVVGNSAYRNSPLRNPVNDARAMAKALGEAGFNVVLLEDATQAAMRLAIRSLGDRLANGGIGLFYYAGHGVQVKGRNYLIPVNANIAREYEIEFSAVDVNLILAMMDSAKNALNIVILDACRNNPFTRGFRDIQNGLAQIDAPTGTFVAFATAPGSVAADGTDDNGVYTKHLLAQITRAGQPIELMFKQVRNGVMEETKGQQIPWESSSLRGEFSFRAGTRQPSVSEAIEEALRKERERQRHETEKLIEEALERQRKQLEQAGIVPAVPLPAAPPAAAPPVSPAPSKPVVASVAPALAPVFRSGMPAAGDTFIYRLSQPQRRDQPTSTYAASVKAVSAKGILEEITVKGSEPLEWVHTNGSYVVNLGVSVYSPYLSAFQAISGGARLDPTVNLDHSTCQSGWTCRVNPLKSSAVRIRVPAGDFDSVRVEIEQSWSGGTAWFTTLGGRTLTIWYAPEVKRAVKFRNREWTSAGGGATTGDFDLDLVEYTSK